MSTQCEAAVCLSKPGAIAHIVWMNTAIFRISQPALSAWSHGSNAEEALARKPNARLSRT